MNQKEIAAVEAFINKPITADNLQPLVPTFPQKEQCANAINQYRCQSEKGHAGICEDNRSVSEIAASVGASVPEPAAQQESEDKYDYSPRPIVSLSETLQEVMFVCSRHPQSPQSAAGKVKALENLLQPFFARQAEPAPTPSRPKNPYIVECLVIQDCITIVEGEWRNAQKSDMETAAFQVARNALVAHLNEARLKRNTWAEASSLGAKEE